MIHTALLKKESYLFVTSIVSIGVLTGQEYFDLALAALLIIPVIGLPSAKIHGRKLPYSGVTDKCATCK